MENKSCKPNVNKGKTAEYIVAKNIYGVEVGMKCSLCGYISSTKEEIECRWCKATMKNAEKNKR